MSVVTDLPFTLLFQDPGKLMVAVQTRAATPKAAVEALNQHGNCVGVLEGHTYLLSRGERIPKELKAGPIPNEVVVLLSKIREGDDNFGLISGFIGTQETAFIAEVVNTRDGFIEIVPRFVAVGGWLADMARDPDGNLLVQPEQTE